MLFVGRMNLSNLFNEDVEQLFLSSQSISAQTFSYQQLKGLPDPVQRYFKHVLKEGQPYISYARITHGGQFKMGLEKPWKNIKGEQYFTTEKPGFIWKGTTSMFTARDMYIAGKGRLIATLFSLFNVVDGQGEHYNQGELLRWLAESIWFPTNLLPKENLKWLAINDSSAKLQFNYNGRALSYIITFNDKDEIIQMETMRYMDNDDLKTWIIKPSLYKEINNILIPTANEVIWRLRSGDFSYAKFILGKIEYDNPMRF